MERNSASQSRGTRFPGFPEDTRILAEVAQEEPGNRDPPGASAQWVRPGSPRTHSARDTQGPIWPV